ncbi:hypothetical protein ABPG74_017181 [Tetrahymena malaccensis]
MILTIKITYQMLFCTSINYCRLSNNSLSKLIKKTQKIPKNLQKLHLIFYEDNKLMNNQGYMNYNDDLQQIQKCKPYCFLFRDLFQNIQNMQSQSVDVIIQELPRLCDYHNFQIISSVQYPQKELCFQIKELKDFELQYLFIQRYEHGYCCSYKNKAIQVYFEKYLKCRQINQYQILISQTMQINLFYLKISQQLTYFPSRILYDLYE